MLEKILNLISPDEAPTNHTIDEAIEGTLEEDKDIEFEEVEDEVSNENI